MTLKAVVDSLDGVPEAAHGLYSEREGKFHLAVEGLVPKARLDEFRNSNIELKRQFEEVTAKYDGIDPAAARAHAAEVAKLRDKQLIEAGKVDELLNERTAAMRTEYDKKLSASEGQSDAMKKQLQGLLIDGALRDAALKAGVRVSAVDDVLLRGRQAFKLVDGKAVAMDSEKPLFGKGGDPLQVGEWISGLVDAAPHLFEPSKGGGAPGNLGGGGGDAKTINRTDHAAILKNAAAIAKGEIKVI